MKRFPTWLLALSLAPAIIVGCAGMPGSQQSGTFNDHAALVVQGATLVLTEATAMRNAGKITPAQDALIRKQTDLIVEGVHLAKSLQANDPTGATVQLTSMLAQMNALKVQTGVAK